MKLQTKEIICPKCKNTVTIEENKDYCRGCSNNSSNTSNVAPEDLGNQAPEDIGNEAPEEIQNQSTGEVSNGPNS